MGVFLFGWNSVDDDIIIGLYRYSADKAHEKKKEKKEIVFNT